MGARGLTILAMALTALGGAARASGPGELAPWYLDQFGGEKADMAALYAGRLGIVMARSPRPQLFIAWRLLHGRSVGQVAGEALSVPCCNGPAIDYSGPPSGTEAWREARKLVPGVAALEGYIPMERDGTDYEVALNCLAEAFDVAAATLKDRANRHGATSLAVRAWLDAQDVVFQGCHDPGLSLPAAMADAPAWLTADRAYQTAALALYDGRWDDAASGFASIGSDETSPWAHSGRYLVARTRVKAALSEKTPARYAQARAAIADLAKAPLGSFGQAEAAGMARKLAYRERPVELLKELDVELNARELRDDAAVAFRDYEGLGRKSASPPPAIEWMMTLAPEADAAKVTAATDAGEEVLAAEARLGALARTEALARAQSRWASTRDVAWLIAALSLMERGAPEAQALVSAGETVAPGHPGWLTVQHQLARLTMTSADAAATRARLDTVLARRDLSVSDRNVFRAARAQVAADARDFGAFATRRRLCAGDYDHPAGCAREAWLPDSIQPFGVYDGKGGAGTIGFGEDARAVIDLLPLTERIALSRDARLPAPLRLDVALTSYGRAVQLQDDAALDGLAGDLATLLPQMAGDFRAVVQAKPGADKRFAAYFILAKIPGVRPDLSDYVRPEGPVAQFQEPWVDWIILPRGRPSTKVREPALSEYQQGGWVGYDTPDAQTDLTCLGECGRGAAPLRLPDFAKAAQGRAAAERGYFMIINGYDETPPAVPPGGRAAWDEIIAYVASRPGEPRAAEALYWLVRAGRWGGSHDHSGRRAFKLLHAAYPKSAWAQKAPYYYD